MKSLFILFLSLTSFVSAHIVTIDKNSPTKEESIRDLLSLQKALIVSLEKPIPDEFAKTGFLLVPMTPEYVSHLLEHKDGHIICDYEEQTLVGYILLTDSSEFTELYEDENVGRFETAMDESTLNQWLKEAGYIEQIGVKYSRRGIGAALMAECKKIKPQGLIADVFIHPVKNEPSLKFFSNQGFNTPGILHQFPAANANFPHPHRTQVFFWSNP